MFSVIEGLAQEPASNIGEKAEVSAAGRYQRNRAQTGRVKRCNDIGYGSFMRQTKTTPANQGKNGR